MWTAPVVTVTPVRLFATYGGRTQSVLLTVLPVRIAGISIAPEPVPSGSTATGTLMLSGPAPAGGVVVHLSSSDWQTLSVPSRVTVPEGAASVTFPVTTFATARDGLVSIDAGAGGGPVT